jgi:hypothetical protein
MGTSPSSEFTQPRRTLRQALRRRARKRPRRFTSGLVPLRAEDRAFWERGEEREEGRLTQEADHLFDTSYTWTA